MPKTFDPFRLPDVPINTRSFSPTLNHFNGVEKPETREFHGVERSRWVICYDGSLLHLDHVRRVLIRKVTEDVSEVRAIADMTGSEAVLFRGGFMDCGKSVARMADVLGAVDPGEDLPDPGEEDGF